MVNEETIYIIWQNQEVGFLTNTVSDMWYLEGRWTRRNSETAVAFEALAKGLDVKETYRSLSKVIDVYLIHKDKLKSRAVQLSLLYYYDLYLRRFAPENSVSAGAKMDKSSWLRRILEFIS